MTDNRNNRLRKILEDREHLIVLVFSVLAAVHVFVFSAAFPFFNVVDEQEHFDLVVRYSHADIPRAVEPLSDEAMDFVAIYYTPEYLWPPSAFADGKIPPPAWKLPADVAAKNVAAVKAIWKARSKNQEASQPPLYYTVAALWWHLGKWLGLVGGDLLYWIRFLNIFIIAAIVWIGHIAARILFSERYFFRIGIPAALAFIPQSAFYGIQNDVLSPLCFGIAFIFLIKFWRAEIPGVKAGILAGLALAATFLTKMSNLPFLAVSGIFIAIKILRLVKQKQLRAGIPAIVVLAVCAIVPAAAWMAWCKNNFGDLTGSEAKIQFLGWTHKPFAEWFRHPIFTPRGFWAFLSDLLSTFWQGELLWDRKPMSLPPVRFVYIGTTIIFAGAALACLSFKRLKTIKDRRAGLWFCFGCFTAGVAFLGFISTIYDFHDCFRPSRDFPYFSSGRMILGALIPFLLLYFYGLDCLLIKIKNHWVRPAILAALVIFMLATEIVTDWKIFPNEYNWFHM
ncbi:MAG TPA: DUF2142 domain-containing protein [Verrucomicrobiae bacterium]|nr:DUF2142 domain-containing protein [Verrucomicrobiae bacterium]